jgi:hypothetical protein
LVCITSQILINFSLAMGHRDEAEKILHEIEKWEIKPVVAFYLAEIYADLGRKDEAFKWLNYEPHHA